MNCFRQLKRTEIKFVLFFFASASVGWFFFLLKCVELRCTSMWTHNTRFLSGRFQKVWKYRIDYRAWKVRTFFFNTARGATAWCVHFERMKSFRRWNARLKATTSWSVCIFVDKCNSTINYRELWKISSPNLLRTHNVLSFFSDHFCRIWKAKCAILQIELSSLTALHRWPYLRGREKKKYTLFNESSHVTLNVRKII